MVILGPTLHDSMLLITLKIGVVILRSENLSATEGSHPEAPNVARGSLVNWMHASKELPSLSRRQTLRPQETLWLPQALSDDHVNIYQHLM